MAFWHKRNTYSETPSSTVATFQFNVGDAVAYTVPSGSVYFGVIIETDTELQWVKVEYISNGRVYRAWDTLAAVDTWECLLHKAGVVLAEVA